jgi:hypothetical protein
MSHVSALEQANRTAKEAGFAILGRAIADAMLRNGYVPPAMLADAYNRRRQEQQSVDRMTQFAALVRQIGDAIYAGKEVDELVQKLVALRQFEANGAAPKSNKEP